MTFEDFDFRDDILSLDELTGRAFHRCSTNARLQKLLHNLAPLLTGSERALQACRRKAKRDRTIERMLEIVLDDGEDGCAATDDLAHALLRALLDDEPSAEQLATAQQAVWHLLYMQRRRAPSQIQAG
jgi:hypothetical protein